MTLKTKLRLAILGLVLAVVLAYSWLYISLLTSKEFETSMDLGVYVNREVLEKAVQALDDAQTAAPGLMSSLDPEATKGILKRAVASNPALNSLLESIPSYSYTVVYAAVVDQDGIIIAHSDPEQAGKQALPRRPFEPLLNSGVLEQLRVALGPAQVYEISNSFDLKINDKSYPFVTVRVGISSVFLGNTIFLKQQLRQALGLVGLALALALVLGWAATSVLLRPLESISVSLDLMTKGQFDAVPAPRARPDEFGEVASKLTLLGQQFRDVRENMAQLLHGLEEALMLFTRDGRAILASDKVQEFLNLGPSEILGRQVEDIFASQPALAVMVSQAIRQGLPFLRREVVMEGNRRVAISVQFISGLVPDDGTSEPPAPGQPNAGTAGAALVSLRDAESVRRLESQIEMSNRLAAIGRLTSGVAHEVRNPLNAIVLHLDALKSKLKTPEPAIAEHLEIIAREIYRLDRVVRTFLDFTRPVRLNLQETDLNGLLREVVGLASAEADTRKVHVVFDPDGIRPMVRVDRDLIKQAILNVVLNGCQAMPEGGQLSVTERISGGAVEIAVADQGPGIAADIQDKVFDLYFTTREKGSGIGLPMAFRAFQLHNGTMEFHNRQEGGTVFQMRLPLASSTG
jgi:signal transduction histidine kinase